MFLTTSATSEQQQQQQHGGLMLTMTINLNDMPFAAHSVCNNDRHDTALCQLALNLHDAGAFLFTAERGGGVSVLGDDGSGLMDFNQTPLWS